MPTKRKLADLYVRGKDVIVDDGSGDTVKVWVQKLTPVDQEKAVRKANAYRSQLVAEAHDETSELFLSARNEVESLTREALISQAAQFEVARHSAALEAEVESQERWTKEGFLQGLYDAWSDGLSDRYALDPEDTEAKRVFEAMQEYLQEVNAKIQSELDRLKNEFEETRTDDQLRKTAVENALLSRVDIQWMAEYRRCQVWLSVREPDNHRTYYFNGRAEVDQLAQETLLALIGAYSDLEVDVVEGKGSGETLASSSSSAPQPTPASSGPEVVAG